VRTLEASSLSYRFYSTSVAYQYQILFNDGYKREEQEQKEGKKDVDNV
jgi:hypothetical protein